MNTLADDFNEFVSHRVDRVESNAPVSQANAFADNLKRTLNQEQLNLFMRAFSFEIDKSSILEEYAYRQGFLDGLRLIDSMCNVF